MVSSFHVLVVVAAVAFHQWLQVPPKITWSPAPAQKFAACPAATKEQMLVFGATSMLGKYIMETYARDPSICLIAYGRSPCKKCHVNVKGDLRDTRHVWRVLDAFKVDTVLTSVKPPLMGVHYREYVELNLLSMIELIKAAKAKGVRNFIYVSSIAASSHYIAHNMSKESETQPLYTDYEAPYDVSKRVAEDFLLSQHEKGKFDVVSIRTSGIYGGEGDPYDYFRWPVIISFGCPVIDANFAANIGDALYVVDRKLKQDPSVGGRFYYYTGEHNSEVQMAEWAREATGKYVLKMPYWIVPIIIEWWTWLRLDPNIYTYLDMMRMSVVPQTFDQTDFFRTFKFQPKYNMRDAMHIMYGNGQPPSK